MSSILFSSSPFHDPILFFTQQNIPIQYRGSVPVQTMVLIKYKQAVLGFKINIDQRKGNKLSLIGCQLTDLTANHSLFLNRNARFA